MNSPPKSIDPVLQSHQRALIELELKRLHQEATAARLDAQASRLQAMLTRLDSGQLIDDQQWNELKLAGATPLPPMPEPPTSEPPTSLLAMSEPVAPRQAISEVTTTRTSEPMGELEAVPAPVDSTPARPAVHRFSSWEAVREAQLKTRATSPTDTVKPVFAPEIPSVSPSTPADPFLHPSAMEADLEADVDVELDEDAEIGESAAIEASEPIAIEIASIDPTDAPPPSRRRPLPMFVSTAVHIVAVLLLATVSLTTTMPKDQLAFSASAESAEETSMETFSLEIEQPPSEPVESAPAETEIDLAPVGEIVAMKMTSELIGDATTLTDSLSSLASPSSNSSLQSLKSTAAPGKKTEFCGVEGGGNHFVYLVDSSGSMGDAFNSARSALLQSIDMLSPDQRFYVVFFDANCDYMRLSDPNVDEPRSVKATDENKRRLRSWAMRISMDKGKAPYEPLRFALGLRPDVIFLLSDGEFPQGIEDLLREENVVTNLFGDSNPISIVHTIGYYSREGETRMKRIASQNQGQYRHVPKP